ncbi:hypothetical protein AB0O76_39730 [Streptomyces sp. NPDC086554]|uniref:hypothetical protein n=1 Tax=Streptomyces sp. NPDC086554 TaxID=3154864 RepID=UPI00343C04E5
MNGAKPVQVLFTPDEYAALLRHAGQLGLPVDEFIRRAVTVDTAEPPRPSAGNRRGSAAPAAVPPIRRDRVPGGAPALQRFLDTLATSAEPARPEQVPPQPTVRSCSGH